MKISLERHTKIEEMVWGREGTCGFEGRKADGRFTFTEYPHIRETE